MSHDQVFSISRGPDGPHRFKAVVDGAVLDAEWPDRTSAMAAMRAEQERVRASAPPPEDHNT